jgi:hypothetical protein
MRQLVAMIPAGMVGKLAREHGVEKRTRSFSAWSHVVSLIFAQVSHALSLNDVCDTLRHHSGALATVRGATPPSRNGLSHANKVRNADMGEALFWEMLKHLQSISPKFGLGHGHSGMPRRFKRMIHIVDSTTIQLIMNCMDWAKHRRRKAAAKCHMRLNLQNFLPAFAIVKEAGTHDSREAHDLCQGIKAGEIVVFDKAYVDFEHLGILDQRDVFWVTRAKENMVYTVVGTFSEPKGPILKDEEIRLTGKAAETDYPQTFRRITAQVVVDGEDKLMTFITNNTVWAPSSVCDLYKARWAIEVFFKQLKQTLQLADFLGHSKQAVRWQIWMALLTYVLLRFIAFQSKWKGSFARLFTILRGILWETLAIDSVIACCGTADPPRIITAPAQAYLPGFQF